MSELSGHPVHYARHNVPYIAWFCDAAEGARFLAYHMQMGDLWVDGDEPHPGVEYRNLGHVHCMVEDCPEGGLEEGDGG